MTDDTSDEIYHKLHNKIDHFLSDPRYKKPTPYSENRQVIIEKAIHEIAQSIGRKIRDWTNKQVASILGGTGISSVVISALIITMIILPPLDEQGIIILLAQAEELKDFQGRYSEALEIYEEILKKDERNKQALMGKGEIGIIIMQPVMAEETYLDAIDYHPEYIPAHKGHFNTLVITERYNDAIDRLEIIEEIEPLNNFTTSLKTKTIQLQNIEQELELDPTNVDLYLKKANILHDWHLYSYSKEVYDIALSIEPNNVNALVGFGSAQIALNEINEGRENCIQAKNSNPQHINSIICIANSYDKERFYDTAIFYFEEALSIDNNDVRVLLGIADSYIKSGQEEQSGDYYTLAIDVYTSLLEEEDQRVYALTGLGNIYFRSGDDDKAISYFDEALSLDPQHVNALLGKGNALSKQGHINEGYLLFKEALEIEPLNQAITKSILRYR